MRIRQVKPSFFKDARIAELPAPVRLTYIGLWMLADDAGYYRWDVAEAGLELYGYESRSRREKDVAAHLAQLVKAGRIEVYECDHVFIPTLTDHQRFGGPTKRVTTYQREHASCPHIPATPRDSPPIPGTVRIGMGTEQERERNVSERYTGASAPDDEALRDAWRRQGLPVDAA